MASLLQDLINDPKKDNLFRNSGGIPISYPVPTFPVFNQQLGGVYKYILPDGTNYTYRRTGFTGGQFVLVTGESNCGKTTACQQMAWEMVDPFGADAMCILLDGERSTDWLRVQIITGASTERLNESFSLNQDIVTWDGCLGLLKEIGEKKEADRGRYTYDTGVVDIFGRPIIAFKPTTVVVDSLKKFVSEAEFKSVEEGDLSDLFAGGREAVFRGKFYRNALEFLYRYNITVFVIHHLNDDIQSASNPFAKKAKALTFMPNGKVLTGGETMKFFTSTMIHISPENSVKEQWTVKDNGYKALKTKFLIYKSRGGDAIGKTSTHVLVPSAGFKPELTLMEYAWDKGLISGTGARCRFTEDGTRFNRNRLMEEFETKPELFRELLMAVKPSLDAELEIFDTTGGKFELEKTRSNKDMMRELGLV